MARIRSIKPEIWQDEALGRCTVYARILYIGLITQADDEGRLRGATELIRSLIFPYDPDDAHAENVERWLYELVQVGLIVRYEADRGCSYISVVGWSDHQKVNHPTPSKLPAPPGPLEDSRNPLEDSRSSLEDSSLARRRGSRIKDQGSRITAFGSNVAAVPHTNLTTERLSRIEDSTNGEAA
jgi:hypothetical protein